MTMEGPTLEKVTTRTEFEQQFSQIKAMTEGMSDRARTLVTDYFSGNLNEEDVKSYLDKNWLPE